MGWKCLRLCMADLPAACRIEPASDVVGNLERLPDVLRAVQLVDTDIADLRHDGIIPIVISRRRGRVGNDVVICRGLAEIIDERGAILLRALDGKALIAGAFICLYLRLVLRTEEIGRAHV